MKKVKPNSGFDLEKEYQDYLKRVKLSESEMHPVQKKETKQAFFAGYASMIVILDKIAIFPEEIGAEILDNVNQQVMDYWKNV